MENQIGKILKSCGIFDYSVCNFSAVNDSLIECSAKHRLPKNAKSVIVALFPYKVFEKTPENISRYAAVADYHNICLNILKSAALKLEEKFKGFFFVDFVDNSPINEVKAAAASGLGVIGKNNLLISNKYGSFVFIGEIVTDMEISCKSNKILTCMNCNKCVDNCPTTYLTDKKICLSSVTQKKRLNEEEIKIIKENNTVWGCDICQEVCPLNKNKPLTDIKEFIESYRDKYVLGEDNKNRPYTWRGPEVIERNYKIKNEKISRGEN